MLDIIIAHNNEEIRNLFYKTFSDLGYIATTVLNHREILNLLNKERPSHIILDAAISDIPAEAMVKKISVIDDIIKVLIAPRDKQALEFLQDIIKILINKPVAPPLQEKPKDISLKIKVLVVDDEIAITELIKNFLSRKGFNVTTSLSGEDAILKVKTNKPDIVLLDIYMTGMDGLIVLQTIKDIDKSIIVIMASGRDDREIIKEAIELGANGYLIKPFNLNKLEETILNNLS